MADGGGGGATGMVAIVAIVILVLGAGFFAWQSGMFGGGDSASFELNVPKAD
jgi:hypothetical protein